MYIPKRYDNADRPAIVRFMKQFSFATLVTGGETPVASHLPFLITEKGDDIYLTSHVARANEQWQQLQNGPALVIFSEPHAYIAPRHYEKILNVPTWNYVAVHAYGTARITETAAETLAGLEGMIAQYDTAYQQQWQYLPDDFKHKMLNGIVAFEIKVTELQAKYKLSQNKTDTERRRIINSLLDSDVENERLTGMFMKRELERGKAPGFADETL
jgi:transcriptional regulator